MITLTFEGNRIKTREDFHREIAILLEFPQYYGKNLDAFWECLLECVTDWKQEEVFFEWKNHLKAKEALGDEYFKKVLDIFNDLRDERKKDFFLVLS